MIHSRPRSPSITVPCELPQTTVTDEEEDDDDDVVRPRRRCRLQAISLSSDDSGNYMPKTPVSILHPSSSMQQSRYYLDYILI